MIGTHSWHFELSLQLHCSYEVFKHQMASGLTNTVEPRLLVELSIKDTNFQPQIMVIYINFDLCNQDTSQLRTAKLAGVLNREVPLYTMMYLKYNILKSTHTVQRILCFINNKLRLYHQISILIKKICYM
jgi:hypothetical protein